MAIIYGVGVGPGDPELMTLKAVRLIRENPVIAVPGRAAEESVAFRIAQAAVPEITDKILVPVQMPMVPDRIRIQESACKGARLLERYLDQGQNVVYLTLGDPTVYCTFSYLQQILARDGYRVELVSGIPSFCAAAARLSVALAEWDEPLHIYPAAHTTGTLSAAASGTAGAFPSGTCVLMKSAAHMKEVKDLLRNCGKDVSAVENCGMDSEKIYRTVDEIPDNAGYFSLIIAKERKTNEKPEKEEEVV